MQKIGCVQSVYISYISVVKLITNFNSVKLCLVVLVQLGMEGLIPYRKKRMNISGEL